MADGQTIFQGLLDRGFNPAQAAALAGNIQQESSFDPNSTNDASGAYGLLNWRLDRRNNLLKYAADTGRSATDPNAQLDFIVSEMQGPEAKNAAPFLSAQDVDSANAALAKYVRYGKNEAGNRLKYAQAFAGQQPQSGGAVTGFVNPSFNGGMPGVPSLGTAPQQPTQPGAPAAVQPAASDDDLLKAFLAPGEATTAAGAGAGNSSDDDLLAPFLKGATEQKSSDPLAGTQQLFPGADALSAAFTSGVEAIPIIGPSAMNALTNLKSGVQNMLSGHSQTPEQIAAIDKAVQAQQPVASTAGALTGEIAPYLVAGGVIPGAARVLGMEGNLLTRVLAGGGSNAAIQYADTLARGGDANQAQRNALLGAGIGAAAAPVADVVGAIGNKLIGSAPEAVAKIGKLATDKYGIPIEAAQISSNPLLRHAGDIVNKLPGLGGVAARAEQTAAFNKALANELGEKADALTPDVMSAARDRIGNMFESVAQRVPVINADQQFQNDLLKAVTDAESTLDAAKYAPVVKQFENIANTFKNGAITGDQYLSLTAKNSILSKAIAQGGDIGAVASEMKDALYGALQRSAPADVAKDLQTARYQWKVMRTLEPLADKSPTGEISPGLLMGAVTKKFGGKSFGQAGNMGELADIAQRFLRDPNSSQTAERGAVMVGLDKLLHSPAAAIAGAGALATVPGAIAGLAAHAVPLGAGYAATRLAAAGLRSKALANRLIDNALQTGAHSNGGTLNMLTRSTAPLLQKSGPVQIIVHGGNPLLAPAQ